MSQGPGNLLWESGELSGIVDWSAACRGPTGDELDPFSTLAGHLEHDYAHWTSERLAKDELDLERACANSSTTRPVVQAVKRICESPAHGWSEERRGSRLW
jgi:hypothetical protein